MALSTRERNIAVVAGSAAGLFLVYWVAVGPYLAKREQVSNAITAAMAKADNDAIVIKRRKRMNEVWQEMNAGGLKSDVVEAESQLLHAVRDWTQEAGLNYSALKPERATTEGKFTQINTHVSASGTQAALVKLLWRLETAKIPIRVTELNVTSAKETADDLQVQLGVSTLCDKPEESNGRKTAGVVSRAAVASAAGGEDR